MKRLSIFLMLFALAAAVNAQAELPVLLTGLTQLESPDLVLGFTGAGWSIVEDGDYAIVESSEAGDSFSFEVGIGDQVILYRELMTTGGGSMEICVDLLCGAFSSESSVDQRGAMLALAAVDGVAVTITNLDGGLIRLDSVLILDAPALSPLAVDPTLDLDVLPGGEVVGFDRRIDGAQVVIIALLAAQLALSVAGIVVNLWKK